MKLILRQGMSLLLILTSLSSLAQEVDLDDITMTVVHEGMFEARQLERPDTKAIREWMRGRGELPERPSENADAEIPADLQRGPAPAIAREPGGIDELRGQRGSRPDGPQRPTRPPRGQ